MMRPLDQMTVAINICVQNGPKTCFVRHVRDLYFIVTVSGLTLTLTFLPSYALHALHTHAVSSVDIHPALWVSVSSLQPV